MGIENTIAGSNGLDYEIKHNDHPHGGYRISLNGETVGTIFVTHLHSPEPQLEVFLPEGKDAKRVFTEEEAVEFIIESNQ